jgi:hypothetical protein
VVPVLLNSAGQPEPPTHIVARLRALHAGLHLKFLTHTGEHWAICLTWSPDDRRWEYIQTGATDPASAYDIIGYLPVDCSADEAPSYLERTFRQYPKDEVRNMADHVHEYNATAPVDAAIEEALTEALESPVLPKKRGRPKKLS